ncbi:ROK family protein, partial [bacterium]|nr:ROK family protein [bacterium]
TRVASSYDLETIHKVEKFPTQKSINQQKEKLSEVVLRVSDQKVKKIVLGVPGVIDTKNKKFVKFSNYHELDGRNFGDLFVEELQSVPLFVDNDAVLAGLGEAILGIGRNYTNVAYITISTGIGGVFIRDKKVSRLPEHTEPGHVVIDENSDLVDGLGIKGSFEALASGKAFEKAYGVRPVACEDDEVWKKYGYVLGNGLLHIIKSWDPDVVVLGGGVSTNFSAFFPGIMDRFAQETNYEIPPILRSEYMDNAGLWGGFVYLRDH